MTELVDAGPRNAEETNPQGPVLQVRFCNHKVSFRKFDLEKE